MKQFRVFAIALFLVVAVGLFSCYPVQPPTTSTKRPW